jgi:CubicO group peptidase (beta-lactamase class C family)
MKRPGLGQGRAGGVRVYSPESVTLVSDRERAPEAGGLSAKAVDTIWQSIVHYYETGLQPGMSICIRRHGQVILERSIGHSRGNEAGAPVDSDKRIASPDDLFNLFSGSKCVTAMLAMHLVERDSLHLDAPVADVLRGCERHGKERITLRHLLTHRAGISTVPTGKIDLDLLTQPEAVLEIIIDSRPESEPGAEAAYHAITGGFVIGAMIREVTGQDPRQLLHKVVCEPLGLSDLSYGVSAEKLTRVARECYTGPPPPPPLERFLIRSLGTDMRGAVDLANDPRFLQGIIPSANIIGTANQIGSFFELLLREGTLNGTQIFQPQTVRRATVRQRRRHELDRVIKLPLRYGLGFMLGSDHLSFYGPGTPRAFGHLGFSQVLAWADPDRDISVAFMNNGKPFITPGVVRWWNVMRVISAVIPRVSKGR